MRLTRVAFILPCLALFSCGQTVEVIIVRGGDPSECDERSYSKEDFYGDSEVWKSAFEDDAVIIDNQTDVSLLHYEVLFGEVDSEMEGEVLTLEPGMHQDSNAPDYVMVVSPDEIKMPAMLDVVSRWELQCLSTVLEIIDWSDFGDSDWDELLEDLVRVKKGNIMDPNNLDDVYQAAANFLIQDKLNRSESIDGLIALGVDSASATTVVDEMIAHIQAQRKEKAQKDMLYGGLWAVGGTVATLSNIGYIFWGAILFGAIQFIRGAINSGDGEYY